MSRRDRQGRSLGLPVAKKSVPKATSEGPKVSSALQKYSNYLVFVEDPRLKTPFSVLPGNNITGMTSKLDIDSTYLNKSRRKRAFDIALSPMFAYPSRVFAKCEASVSLVTLHGIVSHLNDEFKMLITCKVPLEEAYATLMDNYSHKVQEGIQYETGEVTDAAARLKHPPDTDSSYTDLETPPPESNSKKRKPNPVRPVQNAERQEKREEVGHIDQVLHSLRASSGSVIAAGAPPPQGHLPHLQPRSREASP